MDLDYRAIGRRIKLARIKAELTQERLADLVNLSPSHMSNIETGSARISLTTLVNIANTLGVSVDDLLSDSVVYARASLERDLQQIVDGCTEYELRIVRDTARAVVESLHQNKRHLT